ncbi:unnamed protein product [Scytosiphon promiscuus]
MMHRMPDRQVAHMISSLSLTQRSAYIERGIDPSPTKDACERLDNMVQWAPETAMGIHAGGAGDGEGEFFEDGCRAANLRLHPCQQAQVRLSTGAGGLGLLSVVSRRLSASLGNMIGILPAVIASLRGPLGEPVKQKLPDTDFVHGMGETIRELHHI